MKKNITLNTLKNIIAENIKAYLLENVDIEKVMAEVHYYDAKGRYYKLQYLADELREMGIEVLNIGFNSDYDGYIEVMVTKEQAQMLSASKYGRRFNIIGGGRGKTIEDQFNNAIYIDNMLKNKKMLKESQDTEWFVADDGEIYNVFSSDMFDKNGTYLENSNYNIKDFDIVKSFKGPNAMNIAFNYADKLNDKNY